VPAMSDETVIVKGTGTIFLGGPPLVKAATGEEVTAEELGGADVHTRLSGVADFFAEDDRHALQITRTIVSTLNRLKSMPSDVIAAEDPAYDPSEIYGIVSADVRKPYDVHEVLARIVDGSRFDDFKQRYAPTLVTTTGAVALGMAFGLFGRKRREDESDELSAAAASGVGFLPGAVVAVGTIDGLAAASLDLDEDMMAGRLGEGRPQLAVAKQAREAAVGEHLERGDGEQSSRCAGGDGDPPFIDPGLETRRVVPADGLFQRR